jgi:TetR/AcrR family transcriptional regulator
LATSEKASQVVAPAKAVVQKRLKFLDSRLRGNERRGWLTAFCEFIKTSFGFFFDKGNREWYLYLPVGKYCIDYQSHSPESHFSLKKGAELVDQRQERKTNHEPGVRQTLLLAGINLFAEKGYAGTSVREIVALAGVTKPVLYYYFRNKEGLFQAILDWAAEEQENILREALQAPGTAFQRIVILYRRIYQGLMENVQLFKMINHLFFGPPQGAPSYDIERFHRRMAEVIKEIYLGGLRRGEVREIDPEEAMLLVLGVTDYCFHLDYLHPESMDPDRAERLLRLAFQGLSERNEG